MKQKNQRNLKINKDLVFLLNCKKEVLSQGTITKYTLKQGINQKLIDIKCQYKLYFSFVQYDYQGYILRQQYNISVSKSNLNDLLSVPRGLKLVIPFMRLYQTSWFKFTQKQFHQASDLKHPGCYFQIIIDNVVYKNSDTFQSKKLVYQQNRQRCKLLYKNSNYQQALKMYSVSINITQGLPKNHKFTPQEIMELKQMNLKSKQNYIRCLIKLGNVEQRIMELAANYSSQLVKKNQNALNYYLRASYLLKARYLQDSLLAAKKAYQLDKSQQCLKLMNDIIKTIKDKKK